MHSVVNDWLLVNGIQALQETITLRINKLNFNMTKVLGGKRHSIRKIKGEGKFWDIVFLCCGEIL
jgi:hypothetical protein